MEEIKMSIQHRSLKKGRVKTLKYTSYSGKEVEIGVFDLGEYTFLLSRDQTVTVLEGLMVVNEERYKEGDVGAFAAGTTVVIKCEWPCSYLCIYD